MADQFQIMRRPGLVQSAMKAGAKDPRGMVNSIRGYDPTYQADQVQFYNDRAAETGNMQPMSDAVDDASQSFASSTRLQANYTQFPFVGTLPKALTPTLLIPRNRNRSNFYVINLSGSTIYVSFDTTQPQLYGFPIATMTWFNETNGVIGINDIYISGGAAAVNAAAVLGYEGVPPISAL